MPDFKGHFRFHFLILFTSALFFHSVSGFSNLGNSYQIEKLKIKAEKGDKRAQYLLGYAYMSGNSIDYSRRQALIWLKRAAAQNYYNAWYRLGEMHYDSIFGMHNYTRSFKWFFKPALKNHGISQYNVALLYFKGNGVTQNSSKALIWATRAKKNGVAHAAALVYRIQEKMTASARRTVTKPKNNTPSITNRKPTIATTAKVAPKQIDVPGILSIGKWILNGNPSDYLPSTNTKCSTIRHKIRCISEIKKIKKSGYSANYRIVSLITNFGPEAKFTIRYRNKYTSIIRKKSTEDIEEDEDQDDDTNEEDTSTLRGPRLGVDNKVFQFQCRALKSNQIRCFKADNSRLTFTKRGS